LAHIAFLTRLNHHRYPLIVLMLPIVAIGIVGGTAYHATRSHPVWLFMDFVPIIIAISAAALTFWRKAVGAWPRAVFCFLLVGLSGRIIGFAVTTEQTLRISLGYLSAALSLLLPLVIIIRRAKHRDSGLLLGVVGAFVIAIACRMLDRPGTTPLLPMGTHFLWHIFGGVAVWLLMLLIIRLNDSSST
jgi:hemolysin III